jgi:hypothetical protein
MNTNSATLKVLDNPKIHVRFKISALWITLMLLYLYADVLSLFQPGTIEELATGSLEGIQFTQEILFGAAILMSIPSVMVFLTLVLQPNINRWTNIIFGIVYTMVNIANLLSFEAPWGYIIFFNVLESIIALLISWNAWKWSYREGGTS